MLTDFFISMPKLLTFLILVFAAYGFGTAVQYGRKSLLNNKLYSITERKPFNCVFCLSFWFTVAYVIFSLITKSVDALVAEYIVILSFAVAGIVNLMRKLESIVDLFIENKQIDRLVNDSPPINSSGSSSPSTSKTYEIVEESKTGT